jgi:hypothetical protein
MLYSPMRKIKTIKGPWITFSDDRFFFLFADAYRNQIYILKKGTSVIYKTIPLKDGNNCEPSVNMLQEEEGDEPNFTIISYNGRYYIIALVGDGGRLKVLSFSFNKN